MKRLLCLALVTVAGCTGGTETVETVSKALHGWTTYTSPFGSASVYAIFGRATSHDWKHWLLFQRASDLACYWYEVGPAAQQGQSITIETGNGEDVVYVAWDDFPQYVTCGSNDYILTKPLLEYTEGGQTLYDRVNVNTWGGNDYVVCNGKGVCDGGAGNDALHTLVSYESPNHVVLFGNIGNDKLISYAVGDNGQGGGLSGEEGDDCLFIEFPSDAVIYQCGSGADRSRASLGSGCEELETNRCATYPW
jgi:hypothetical protein